MPKLGLQFRANSRKIIENMYIISTNIYILIYYTNISPNNLILTSVMCLRFILNKNLLFIIQLALVYSSRPCCPEAGLRAATSSARVQAEHKSPAYSLAQTQTTRSADSTQMAACVGWLCAVVSLLYTCAFRVLF